MVYEGGEVVRVPMREVLEKTPGKDYNYGNRQRLIFACPVMPDEALLLVMRDGKNNYVYRAEHVTSLVQDNINTTGETLFDVEYNGILHCEVVASDCIQHYADGIDLPRKQVGYNIKRGAGTFEDSIAQLLNQANTHS